VIIKFSSIIKVLVYSKGVPHSEQNLLVTLAPQREQNLEFAFISFGVNGTSYCIC
jgi:hypothetical protein